MSPVPLVVREVDPQGQDAISLLRKAAIEARALYPELHGSNDSWPTNGPTPPRGIYLVAYRDGCAVGMGAHRPIDEAASEVRRMFVVKEERRAGVAQSILRAIEAHASAQGFRCLRLETGNRQEPAIRLYEQFGFHRIPAFGSYVDDPTSVCFEKALNGYATSGA
jgi:GNAT superfamily N-acetyltransferase